MEVSLHNQPIYKSLSDDEENVPDAEQTAGSAKTNKRKRSRVWATFELLPGAGIGNDKHEKAKCRKCDYVCDYDSKHGIGNLLEHQKLCQSSVDTRQMVLSSTLGSMSLHNGGSFVPKIYESSSDDEENVRGAEQTAGSVDTKQMVLSSTEGSMSLHNGGSFVPKRNIMSMKLGAIFPTVGTSWDDQGKSDISQIFISTSRSGNLDFIQFAYVVDGIVELSDKIGGGEGCTNLKTITFDYPTEKITRVNGCYLNDGPSKKLCYILFQTNKREYGPYGSGVPIEDYCDDLCYDDDVERDINSNISGFDYEVGGEFWGFFGTYKSNGIESIGIYMKPRQPANLSVGNRPGLP